MKNELNGRDPADMSAVELQSLYYATRDQRDVLRAALETALNELRNAHEAVKKGVPETVGYGEIGAPAFAHGWNAAMGHVYGELAAARALLRQLDARADAQLAA